VAFERLVLVISAAEAACNGTYNRICMLYIIYIYIFIYLFHMRNLHTCVCARAHLCVVTRFAKFGHSFARFVGFTGCQSEEVRSN
jgi:hypothetical protein